MKVFLVALLVALSMLGQSAFGERTLRADTIMPASNDLVYINTASVDSLDIGTLQVSRLTVTSPGGIIFNSAQGIELNGSSLSLPASVSVSSTSDTSITAASAIDINGGDTIDISSESVMVNSDSTSIRAQQITSTSSSIGFSGTDSLLLKSNNGQVTLDFVSIDTSASSILVDGSNGVSVSMGGDMSVIADASVLIRSDSLSWTATSDLSFYSISNNVELLAGNFLTTTITDSMSLIGTQDVTFVTRSGATLLRGNDFWESSSSIANIQATDSIEFFATGDTFFDATSFVQFNSYSGYELITNGQVSISASTTNVQASQLKLFGFAFSVISNSFSFSQTKGVHFSSDGNFAMSANNDIRIVADTELTIDSTSRRDNSISFGIQTNNANQDVVLLVDATNINAVTRTLAVTATTPLDYSYNSVTFSSDNTFTVGASSTTINANTGAARTNINGGSVTFTSPNIDLNGNGLTFTAVSRPGQTIAITGTTLTSNSATTTVNGGSVTFDASSALEFSTGGLTTLSSNNDFSILANALTFTGASQWSYDSLQVVATGAGITLQNSLTRLTSTMSDIDVTCVNFVYDPQNLDITSGSRTDVRSLTFTQTSQQLRMNANNQISFFGIGQFAAGALAVTGKTYIESAPNGLVSIAAAGTFSLDANNFNIYNTRTLTVGQSALTFNSPTVSISNSNGPINFFASSVTYNSGSQTYTANGDIMLSGSVVSITPTNTVTFTAANTLGVQSNGNFLITPTTVSVTANNQVEFNTQTTITLGTGTTSILSNQIGFWAGSQINLQARQTTFNANQILSSINNLYQTTATSYTATTTNTARWQFGTLVGVTATDDLTFTGDFNAQANQFIARAEGATTPSISGNLNFFDGIFERGPITLETNAATFNAVALILTSNGRSDWAYTTVNLQTSSGITLSGTGDITQQAQNAITLKSTSGASTNNFETYGTAADINFDSQSIIGLDSSSLSFLAYDSARSAKFNATTLGDISLAWQGFVLSTRGSSFDPVLGRDYGFLFRSNNGPLLVQAAQANLEISTGNQLDFIGVGGINIVSVGNFQVTSPVTINTGGQLSVQATAGPLSFINGGDLHVASDGLLSISATTNLQIVSKATTDPSNIGVKLYSSDGPITISNANSASLDVTLAAGGAIIGQAGQSTTIQSSQSAVFTTTGQFWITSQGLLSVENQNTLALSANQQLSVSSSLNNDITLNIGGAVAMNAKQISLNAVNDIAVTSGAIVSLVSSNTFSVLSSTSITFDALTTTDVTSASSFNVTGTSSVNFDALTTLTIAVAAASSGTLQINAGGNSLLNGVEINSSGNTVISGDAAVNLNAYSLSQHSSSTLGTTLQTASTGSISLVSLGTFSGSQKDILISSAGLLSASVGTSLDIGQSQLIFLQSGQVLSVGTTAAGPVSLSSQRFLDVDTQNNLAISAAGWTVLTNKLQSTSFLSTTFTVANSINLTPTGAFTSESSGPTTYTSTGSSVSIFSTANNSPISFITLADSSNVRVTSTGDQLVMTATSKLDVVAPFGSSYTSTSTTAGEGILFSVANDFLVNSGGNLLLASAAQLSFTADDLTINSVGLQTHTVGSVLSLQSTADTLYAADQDLTFQSTGTLSLSSAQTINVVSGGNMQMSLPTWNLVASSTTLTAAANARSTIAATTSTSLTTSQSVTIDAGGGVSVNAKTLAFFGAKTTETITANGPAGIVVTSSAPLSATSGQSMNLLGGSSVQIGAEGTEQATGYITLAATNLAAGAGLSVIANNSIQVDSLGGGLQLSYNTLQISSPIALSFAANGQSGSNGNSITVAATTSKGAISMSAAGMLQFSGSQVNFEHIGGSLGSLSVAANVGQRAQFYMEANAANERGNSIELLASNGALSLSSSNGFGLFETDGLLRVDSQTGVTVASNAGDILISSDNYVGFLANTVESATNPPVAIVLDTYSTTANTVFTTRSNLDIGSGGSTNFVQSDSATFVTRQSGRLSMVSDENLTINTKTFTAVGMSDYSYLRGFEGLDLLSTGAIGFNGVVGIVVNDRNLRQINRDKNLIIGGSQLVYVASQAVFFSDVDVPSESNFILPTGNANNCAFGEFGFDETNGLIYICGLLTLPVS